MTKKKITIKQTKYARDVFAHHITQGPLLIAKIEHCSGYKKHPYAIEKNSGARFVTKSGYDCFARISDVKEAIQAEIADFYKHPEFLQDR